MFVGKSAEQVSAEWNKVADERGKNQLYVRIWDATADAKLRFTPEQFKIPNVSHILLYRLWGDLLEERSEKQMRRLMEPDTDDGE